MLSSCTYRYVLYRTTKGGLRTNDVILRVNGKSVQTSDETRRLIDSAPVGVVRLVILPSKIRCFSPLQDLHSKNQFDVYSFTF